MQYIYIYSLIFELYGLYVGYMVYIWNLTMLEQQGQLWMSWFIFYEHLVFDIFFRQLGLCIARIFMDFLHFQILVLGWKPRFSISFNLKTDFQILGSFCLRIKFLEFSPCFSPTIFSSRHGGPCCTVLGSANDVATSWCISNENAPAKWRISSFSFNRIFQHKSFILGI